MGQWDLQLISSESYLIAVGREGLIFFLIFLILLIVSVLQMLVLHHDISVKKSSIFWPSHIDYKEEYYPPENDMVPQILDISASVDIIPWILRISTAAYLLFKWNFNCFSLLGWLSSGCAIILIFDLNSTFFFLIFLFSLVRLKWILVLLLYFCLWGLHFLFHFFSYRFDLYLSWSRVCDETGISHPPDHLRVEHHGLW